jgi:hypothetical protein
MEDKLIATSTLMINFDFTSLYPHMKRFGGKKIIIRKRKIKKIFTDI